MRKEGKKPGSQPKRQRGGAERERSYHAAEHFILVVGEEQHHIGPPRASRHPGDLQAAAQRKQQQC